MHPRLPLNTNFLGEILHLRARAQPSLPAFTFLKNRTRDAETHSYGELDSRARIIAGFLQDHARPGDRILLFQPPDIEYVASFFGCLYAGMIAVPLYPLRPGQKRFQAESVVRTAGRPSRSLAERACLRFSFSLRSLALRRASKFSQRTHSRRTMRALSELQNQVERPRVSPVHQRIDGRSQRGDGQPWQPNR